MARIRVFPEGPPPQPAHARTQPPAERPPAPPRASQELPPVADVEGTEEEEPPGREAEEEEQEAEARGDEGEDLLGGYPPRFDEEDDPIEEARSARKARSSFQAAERIERHGGRPAPATPRPARPPRPDRSARPEPETRPADLPTREQLEEGIERAREILPGLLEQMGFDLAVSYEIEEDHVFVAMSGEDGSFLLEGRADGLNSLQYLLNKMVYRGGPTRIVLDANGYRKERQAEIIARAKDAARDVRQTRRARSLGTFNPFERRLIHVALRDDPEVRTVSHGEGFLKRIEIAPREERTRDRQVPDREGRNPGDRGSFGRGRPHVGRGRR